LFDKVVITTLGRIELISAIIKNKTGQKSNKRF